MAVFLFLVGFELKREVLKGELPDPKNIILPGIDAVGGMLAPAAIYVLFNSDDPVAVKGVLYGCNGYCSRSWSAYIIWK